MKPNASGSFRTCLPSIDNLLCEEVYATQMGDLFHFVRLFLDYFIRKSMICHLQQVLVVDVVVVGVSRSKPTKEQLFLSSGSCFLGRWEIHVDNYRWD